MYAISRNPMSPETPTQRAVLAALGALLCAACLYLRAYAFAIIMAAGILGCIWREIRYRRRRRRAAAQLF